MGHIKSFIVNGGDYFAANLQDGGVRIGMVDGTIYDFPVCNPPHKRHAQVLALTNEAEAEALHDELTGEYCRENWA